MGFTWGSTGMRMGGWFRKEIKNSADLNGSKMRIGGIAGQVIQKLGVVPQQIAGGDIHPAPEKGTIDAAEWIGPHDDAKLGSSKVAPFHFYPGWWQDGPTVHAFVNPEKYASLPKAYRAAILAASAYANTRMQAGYDMQNPTALKRLVQSGTQLRPFPQGVMEACLKAPNELHADISIRNEAFKEAILPMIAFRNDEHLVFQVAELTYDNYRTRARARG